MEVNVTALMRCSRAALKHMVSVGTGSIVNIASDFAVVAGRGEAVYCASKGAVLQLTKAMAMALDHGPQGIRVSALSAIRSALAQRASQPGSPRPRKFARQRF